MTRKISAKQGMLDCGFKFSRTKKELGLEARLSQLTRFAHAAPDWRWESDSHAARVESWLKPRAHDHDGMGDDWQGGTAQSLLEGLDGKLSMAPFLSAYAEFQKRGLTSDLAPTMQAGKPRRRRRPSEYDGEWQYERRHEEQPFIEAYKKPVQQKTVEIDVGFTISAGARSREINAYGATAWAVSRLIEAAGIQTRIVQTVKTESFTRAGAHDSHYRIVIKEPGEYLAPEKMANAFRAVFFRRLGFALITACAEFYEQEATSGLGHCEHREPVKFQDGKIWLSPDAYDGYDAQLADAIKQAIGAEKAKSA